MNTQGILDSIDRTIHHGNSYNYEGGKADKNEKEKEWETRSLDEFFLSKELFLVCTIQKRT